MSGRSRRIAVTSYYLPSESKIGAGYVAHRLAETMRRRGHHVTMFSPCARPDDATYEHVVVPLDGSLRTFRWGGRVGRLDLSGFDVLHAHGDNHFRSPRSSPPVVRTLHGSCFSEARHITGMKERLRMVALGCTEIVGSLTASSTVAVSQGSAWATPWVSRVIPNGVDLDRFRPGEKEERPTVLFVGTYHQRKRGRLLMEVFADRVRPAIPDARLWMVCTDAPAAPGVEVLGRIDDAELADRYRRAWVFCLPSSYEGFGVPYVEAMASGTAVVATPNPGALDVLEQGKWGVIAEPDRLGDELVDLLRRPGRRVGFEMAAVEHARAFDWNRIAERYEVEYESAIERHERPGRSRSGS